MRNLKFLVISFISELFKTFRDNVGWVRIVATLLAAVATFAATLFISKSIGLVFYKIDGSKMTEYNDGNVYITASILTFIVLFSFLIGVVWVRFARVIIDNNLFRRGPRYFVTITNRGYSDTQFQCYLDRIIDDKQQLTTENSHLPRELAWDGDEENEPPVLKNGLRKRVHLVGLQFWNSRHDRPATCGLNFCFVGGEYEDIGRLDANKGNKIWFKILFGSEDRYIWYSVRFLNDLSAAEIVAEEPPKELC